jgi:hypothetical protein
MAPGLVARPSNGPEATRRMRLAHADAKRRRRNVDTRQVDLPVVGSLRLTQDDNVTRLDAGVPGQPSSRRCARSRGDRKPVGHQGGEPARRQGPSERDRVRAGRKPPDQRPIPVGHRAGRPAGTPNTLPSAAVIRTTCEWTRNCCSSATATPSMVSERSVTDPRSRGRTRGTQPGCRPLPSAVEHSTLIRRAGRRDPLFCHWCSEA